MSNNTFPTLVRAAAHDWCSGAASVCKSCKETVPGCLTLWWLHSRGLKPAPSRKQLEVLLDHLPPLHIEYEPGLSAPEPADNETLPDTQ